MKRLFYIKRFIILLYVLEGLVVPAQAALTTSYAFFSVEQNFQLSSPEGVLFFTNTFLDELCCNCIDRAFQIAFYGCRVPGIGSEKLVWYFLPSTCNFCYLEGK